VAVVVAWIQITAFAFFHVIRWRLGPPSRTGVTAWQTRCSGWASCRSSPSAQPSSALHGAHRREPSHRPPRASGHDQS
jgi:hypothetical protein